jgi:hypothetical protein
VYSQLFRYIRILNLRCYVQCYLFRTFLFLSTYFVTCNNRIVPALIWTLSYALGQSTGAASSFRKNHLPDFKSFFKTVLSFRFVCYRQRVVFVREIHPSTNHIHITCSYIIRPVHSKVSPTNDWSSAVSDVCYSAESDLLAAV